MIRHAWLPEYGQELPTPHKRQVFRSQRSLPKAACYCVVLLLAVCGLVLLYDRHPALDLAAARRQLTDETLRMCPSELLLCKTAASQWPP